MASGDVATVLSSLRRAAAHTVALVALSLVAPRAEAAPPAFSWAELLDRDAVGASAWTRAHPTWDGRGVVVAILDTGVDPTIRGLDALPGRAGPKVIEARDFSGEGLIALTRARPVVEAGVARLRADLSAGSDDASGLVVAGHDRLAEPPQKDAELWLGALYESDLVGSDTADLDRDGATTSRFAVLVYARKSDGLPVVVVDTDGDGDLADEAARQSYADDPRTFAFAPKTVDPRVDRPPVAIAVDLDWSARKVALHFDDGGHGSHCAGIAAGYRLEGKDGFDGIAPGAEVMSLKIGHNALSGGATTSGSMLEAVRFASRWARDHARPVVINLSYGIGNEREGRGKIDKLLDDELAANPWLALAASAGNEGPGLSTVGMPGSAALAWASAAMLPEALGKTLWGGQSRGRKLFQFSSRGGELAKPDGLAPGGAWSTVPAFEASAVKSGTSMASPQAAGVMALLASAALDSRLPWTSGLARRALATGARPIAGYTALDQGAGLIDVGRAWEAYRREAADPAAVEIAGWRVATPVPSRPGLSGSGSLWRVGRYLPAAVEPIAFSVTPLLYTTLGERARADHVETLSFESDVGWLAPDRRTVIMKGSQAVDVMVRLEADQLPTKPGLHVGRVRAKTRGNVAFDLPVSVIVPEALGGTDVPSGIAAWSQRFEGSLAPGELARVFVAVPPGATTLSAHLAVSGSYGNAWLLPFDPEGHAVEAYEHRASVADAVTGDFLASGPALVPGLWELVVTAPFRNREATRYALDVAFRALEAPDALVYKVSDAGELRSELSLVNGLEEPFRGTIEAVATGIRRTKKIDVKGDRTTFQVALGEDFDAVDLRLEVDDESWERMTDIAVNVLDPSGAIVRAEAFSGRRTSLRLERPAGAGSARFTVEVRAALADASDDGRWSIALRETQQRATPRAFTVELPQGMARATLYPGVRTPFVLRAAPPLPEPPDGFEHRVELALTARDGTAWTRLELPLRRK